MDKQQFALNVSSNIELTICVNKSNNFVLAGILCMAIAILLALTVSFVLLGIEEGIPF